MGRRGAAAGVGWEEETSAIRRHCARPARAPAEAVWECVCVCARACVCMRTCARGRGRADIGHDKGTVCVSASAQRGTVGRPAAGGFGSRPRVGSVLRRRDGCRGEAGGSVGGPGMGKR